MNINNDAVLDLKIAAYTAEANGKISAEQRDFILEFANEVYEYIDMYDTRGDDYSRSRAEEGRLEDSHRHGAKRNSKLSDDELENMKSNNEFMKSVLASRPSGMDLVKKRIGSNIRYAKNRFNAVCDKMQASADERKKRRAELVELRRLQKKQPKTRQDKTRIAALSRTLGAVAECVQECFENMDLMDLIERAYTLNDDERENVGILYPVTECFFAKDEDGYYCYTTEGRSFSYSDIDSIPLETVKILMSL